MIEHPFAPIFDKNSSILILGSFPSEKSRECGFFYGHPRNCFWKLIANITKTKEIPKTIDEKINILISNQIAIWDVIFSCDVIGSSDSSIKNVVPNDLSKILKFSNIKQIYANGEKAYRIYMKYCYQSIKREIIKLPSTSPANAIYSFDQLRLEWESKLIKYISKEIDSL
ncbi:MAG: DNA-deoxyinosine glycosylase [Alphaproteobacteria bacterium]|nr:DNA-deoxyinosine glycosylase [Alphaproteobacteria bacterium]